MAKKIVGIVKLQLNAGKATMQPPVGPALGPYGVNGMNFVKEFNERTKKQHRSYYSWSLSRYMQTVPSLS